MEADGLSHILSTFGIASHFDVSSIGSGLIHKTWKVKAKSGNYILQKINDKIFKAPFDIEQNIRSISKYLQQHQPGYLFVSPIADNLGKQMLFIPGHGYFRMFPFIKDSITFDVLETSSQAYEAAKQFGKFTKELAAFNVGKLKLTIPHFHDLELRYQQFIASLNQGNKERVKQSDNLVKELLLQETLVEKYKSIKLNPAFRQRVIHHDTKISNVLFDSQGKGLCVIDLDTVMPGYYISDVGDMMRTYLSPVTEEESDLEKIVVREEFYQAIAEGYLSEMGDVLCLTEKEYFFYSGEFLIYMQALRFLTDYFNNDVYYGARYPEHNYVRALNQATLLKRYQDKRMILERYTSFV